MKKQAPWVTAIIGAAAAVASSVVAHDPPPEQRRMAEAARKFVESLSDEHRRSAALKFDDPARTSWAFVPGDRAGLWLKDMAAGERRAAHDLMRAALSSEGYLKVHSITKLDAVLRDLERAAGGSGASRDPEKYAIAIFGTPTTDAPWSWRLEGHHVSLNFTAGAGGNIAVTPTFLGANPAEVRDGPEAGLRVLAEEEDLARELLVSLTNEQRARAVIDPNAPADILALPGRGPDALGARVGLPASEMTGPQRETLNRLLEVYAHTLKRDMAEAQLARVREEGWSEIRFAWAGPAEPGKPHYYRIHGRRFVIEYDNTQNGANHVHTVWRDFEADFGDSMLRHYTHGHE